MTPALKDAPPGNVTLFQPVNTKFWGIAFMGTIPEIIEWAKWGGLIFVERPAVVFAEFEVKASDGSQLHPEALVQLRALGADMKAAAIKSIYGMSDSYLAAAHGPTARLGMRSGDIVGVPNPNYDGTPPPSVANDVARVIELLTARSEDTTTPDAMTPAPETIPPPVEVQYKCRLSGYETTEPRFVRSYREPLRCYDYCCDGPVSPNAPAYFLDGPVLPNTPAYPLDELDYDT